MSPTGSDMLHGPIPDVMFARTPAPNSHQIGTDRNYDRGGMTEGARDQIARTLCEFGFTPKGRARASQKPYPDYFDTIHYPRGFRVPSSMVTIPRPLKNTYVTSSYK
jgi:hypothetical protein